MANNTHTVKIGRFECTVIADGTHINPRDGIFSNAPSNEVEELMQKYGLKDGGITTPSSCLFIRDGEHSYLIDTGWGPGVEVNAGKALQNLEAAGIKRTDIETIFISHCHPDHIGGITDIKGELNYSNAKYVMIKEEYEFWTSNPDLSKLAASEAVKEGMVKAINKNMFIIKNKLNLISSGTEYIPGIKLITISGHTPNNCYILISSEGKQLLCTADMVVYTFQLEKPQWFLVFDSMPEEARTTRNRVLSKAVKDHTLIFACHFPYPGIGYIEEKNGLWNWHPVEK